VTLDSRKAARSDAKRVDRRGAGAIDGAGGGTCRLDLVRYCAEAPVPWCHPTLAPQSAGPSPYTNFKVLPPDPHHFDGDKDGIGCET
jgi:micrococcal nuclease